MGGLDEESEAMEGERLFCHIETMISNKWQECIDRLESIEKAIDRHANIIQGMMGYADEIRQLREAIQFVNKIPVVSAMDPNVKLFCDDVRSMDASVKPQHVGGKPLKGDRDEEDVK